MADAKEQNISEPSKIFKAKLAFLLGVTFASVIGGFGLAVGATKKRTPTSVAANIHEEGTKLAMRALGWGTVYSVGGVATLAVVAKSVYELKKVMFK